MRIRFPAVVFAGVMVLALQAVRGDKELHENLPDDTLAFVELNPVAIAAQKPGNAQGLLGLGFDALQSFGVLPKEAALIGDIASLASVAGDHRSCLALIDADL